VTVREWREAGEPPTLQKEYATPAGTLTAIVEETEDWPYPGHVPLFDDYLVPRSRKFLVETWEDLEALRHILTPPRDELVAEFRAAAQGAKTLADELGVIVLGGMGIGLEATAWLCGMQQTVLRTIDEPEFVRELVELLHEWNMARMEAVLECGVDLFWRRGWYEGTDFWSPALYREFVFPYLRREAELAHRAGAKFGYINTSGTMAVLPQIIEAGVDVLVGVDPVMGKDTELRALKRAASRRLCLWGGVNGFLTVERGTREQIDLAVRGAVEALGPEGFILSPVDNVRDASAEVWAHVLDFIDAWRKLR
jgi:uroporphyrinogen decarboxylase